MAHETRVYVIEDDEAMRDSLSFLLSTAGIAVESFESASAFLASERRSADCIVTDVRMPGISGIELLQELRARGSTVPVIVITGHGDIAMAVAAMKIGASDFFEKPFDDQKFMEAIDAAVNHKHSLNPSTGDRARILEKIASLSARERQVLDRLVTGLPNKSIAFDLGISTRTIEVYRANLMSKMQARSLSELVRMAIAAGLTGD